MKKSILIAAAALLLGTVGMSFAQTTAAHDVHVKIPSVLRIRLTTAAGTSPITNGDVMFDYSTAAGQAAYETAVAGGGNWLNPVGAATTGEVSFGDVKVFSNSANAWKVNVSATESGTFALGSVRVTPTGTIGTGVNALPAQFTLSSTSATIATGGKTKGWSSLGFGGGDYQIYVDGTEDPGTTVIAVTYSIAAP